MDPNLIDENRKNGTYHGPDLWHTNCYWRLVTSLFLSFFVFLFNTFHLGLSGTEFLSSIEQFDKSSASWNVPLQRDWRIINHVLNSARYEMAVASIPISQVGVSLLGNQLI